MTELRIVYRPEHYDQKEMGKKLDMIPNRWYQINIFNVVSNESETTTELSRRKRKQRRMNHPKLDPRTVAHWRIFTSSKLIIE